MAAVRSAMTGAADTPDGARLLDRVLLGVPPDASPLTHVEAVPARAGRAVAWPGWVPANVREAFEGRGVRALWEHQERAATLAHDGRSAVVATGTGSGKS